MPQFDDRIIESRVETLRHREEENLVKTMAPKYGVPYVDLTTTPIDVEALSILPENTSREAEVAIFDRQNKALALAVRNPNSPRTTAIVEELEGQRYTVNLYLASRFSLLHAWERYKDLSEAVAEEKGVLDVNPEAINAYSKEITSHLDAATKVLEVQASNNAEKVSGVIEAMFGGALALNASDIHVEPEKNDVRIRYRLDGVLWDVTNVERELYAPLASRLKLLSGLKLNVRNEAQEGRFTFTVGERNLEVRTSVIPDAYGESIVMRILDPDTASFTLENLGLNEPLHKMMLEELKRPNGAIVTTGPTGSGKTTALYAFMRKVHNPSVKIVTIEDPVEYRLPGIVQTQVDDEEYTFAKGLRSILRQDPDIIMVGEIRDREVAETAVHAALTGHLVFSTLHTNSAPAAFARLIDLGVDPRMIGSAFNVILGQRLVRILCEHCKVSRDATTEEQKLIARIMGELVRQHTVYDAKGCDKCGGSGFKGRIGLFEAIRVDKAVEEAVLLDPRENNVLQAAKPQGIPTMQQDGVLKVLHGITSLNELARVVDLHNTRVDDTPQEATDKTIARHTV